MCRKMKILRPDSHLTMNSRFCNGLSGQWKERCLELHLSGNDTETLHVIKDTLYSLLLMTIFLQVFFLLIKTREFSNR